MSRNEMKAIIAGNGQQNAQFGCYPWACGPQREGTCRNVYDPEQGGFGCRCSVDPGTACE
ncbi:hypothetical protein HHL16_00390 [Pseudoflavitalea sp. G-6-1-2]|uniref:hypothetical protein n=1 Tax=Pseudoflavitalea sp. G-6-1-2 TaxID=2728841 RepID=UPI00146ED3CE|nr:hypothetical protein [Pseudoflavitalea sp. G-6-1-2]NML19303.1 hypothetical protein [Pseudoflavitalea sp. G-6-1-2]